MKNLSRLFFALLLVVSFNASAQDSDNPWKIVLGANAVDLYPVGEDAPRGDYFDEFQSMCKNVNFVKLTKPAQIYNSYAEATDQGGVHLILEYPDLYETTDE